MSEKNRKKQPTDYFILFVPDFYIAFVGVSWQGDCKTPPTPKNIGQQIKVRREETKSDASK
jgi:hypothetical protein